MSKLRKSRNRWVDGVLGGLGEYFQINPDLLRVGFIILVALNFQILIGAYVILMIFMPGRKRPIGDLADDPNANNVYNQANKYNDPDWDEDDYDDEYDEEYDYDYEEVTPNSNRSLQFFGGLLVFIGIYVLFQDRIEIYTRQFYLQLRHLRYYLVPYREGILATILILIGTLLWWRGRK